MLFTHVLAPDCIATLLEFSGSGMPVSVLLKDHDYFVTCLSIVNLQMRREEIKKKQTKTNPWKNRIANLQMDVHDSDFSKVMESQICFGNLVFLLMLKSVYTYTH